MSTCLNCGSDLTGVSHSREDCIAVLKLKVRSLPGLLRAVDYACETIARGHATSDGESTLDPEEHAALEALVERRAEFP